MSSGFFWRVKVSVISHPSQVTPAWLTSILKGNGWRGAITSVRWQPIGAGQMGDNARFTLTGTDDIPATLVGKFPSEDPTSRYTAQTLGNYEREVFFSPTWPTR